MANMKSKSLAKKWISMRLAKKWIVEIGEVDGECVSGRKVFQKNNISMQFAGYKLSWL